MNNKVFYQHPNLMRVLGMHETVMEVMVNVLGTEKSQVMVYRGLSQNLTLRAVAQGWGPLPQLLFLGRGRDVHTAAKGQHRGSPAVAELQLLSLGCSSHSSHWAIQLLNLLSVLCSSSEVEYLWAPLRNPVCFALSQE